MLRTLGRAISLSVWSGVVVSRWLLLLPVFGTSAILIEDIVASDFRDAHVARRADAWDLFPAMLLHTYFLHILIGFGFLLLIGDVYRRERDGGVAAVSIVRMPSRSLYWLGKMGAMGVMSLGFVAVGLAVVLLAGTIIAPPEASWPTLPREAVPGMYPEARLSVPVYTVLLAGYTALALWVVGSAAMLLSVFVRHRVALLAAVTLWTLLSASCDVTRSRGAARLLSLGYFIGIFKHHGDHPLPWGAFFAVAGAALVLIALLGSWRLRREEI